MNLLEAIRIYVQRKRADGHLYLNHEKRLIYFSRHVGDVSLRQITVRQILTFLDSPKISPMAWKKKHEFLRAFFDFWLARGEIVVSPMPPKRNAKAQASIPYIYTHREIQRLLTSAGRYQIGRRGIDSLTVSTFLILIYGIGCRPGEALELSVSDVDLKRRVISVSNRNLNTLRELPIGLDLKRILGKYISVRKRVSSANDHLFLNKWGRPFVRPTIYRMFQRIRADAGIVRRDGAFYQPRMHDLRHTFAVHRITSWIKHGADLKRMLPALAVYMGQSGLGSTERYLSLTAERFRPQLSRLSPGRKGKRWRDDAELMKFLADL